MCDCVLRYVFRFWLSLTITCHTCDKCYSSSVIDADLHRTRGRFSESSMHRRVVQEWRFTLATLVFFEYVLE